MTAEEAHRAKWEGIRDGARLVVLAAAEGTDPLTAARQIHTAAEKTLAELAAGSNRACRNSNNSESESVI
jgi:hypothetical protein